MSDGKHLLLQFIQQSLLLLPCTFQSPPLIFYRTQQFAWQSIHASYLFTPPALATEMPLALNSKLMALAALTAKIAVPSGRPCATSRPASALPTRRLIFRTAMCRSCRCPCSARRPLCRPPSSTPRPWPTAPNHDVHSHAAFVSRHTKCFSFLPPVFVHTLLSRDIQVQSF